VTVVDAAPPRICVVGTGPGGFYTAKYLLREHPDLRVDLLDALPTPFGLVRSGVAPDHPEVKAVMNDFESVAASPRVAFLGNVAIGRDVSVAELAAYYNGVVLAYGAASDRMLGIPGERELANVTSARAFVNWYNGHPDFRTFAPNLDTEEAVVIGQGNVAIDCARILCKTPAELAGTDIAEYAAEALARSRVRRVTVVGRRGHVQAAFTMKELREVTRLADAALVVSPSELAKGRNAASLAEMEEARGKKRMDALLAEGVAAAGSGAGGTRSRTLALRFFLAPTAFVPDATGKAVAGVTADVTALEGEAGSQRAVPTGATETLPAGLVLRSIGYKSISVPGVPFDDVRAVVRNTAGRVVNEDGSRVPGLFVSGWLKRGPSGIIGTNIPDAKETAGAILADVAAAALPAVTAPAPGIDGLRDLLIRRGRAASDLVSWRDYTAINAAEVAAGAAHGKPREKLTDVAAMLAAAAARRQ